MIEVVVTTHGGKTELARIKIENAGGTAEEADYSVQYAVNRALGAIGLHQRAIYGFRRTKYNALALVRQALLTLDEKELELEDGVDASDMARQVRGALPAFPGEAPREDGHHRSAFWRR